MRSLNVEVYVGKLNLVWNAKDGLSAFVDRDGGGFGAYVDTRGWDLDGEPCKDAQLPVPAEWSRDA